MHRGKLSAALLAANKKISRGAGSPNYWGAHKANGNAGTWRNIAGRHPAGALPEMNFWPQGNEKPAALYRYDPQAAVEIVELADQVGFDSFIRLQKQLVATGLFMLLGAAIVYFVNHLSSGSLFFPNFSKILEVWLLIDKKPQEGGSILKKRFARKIKDF